MKPGDLTHLLETLAAKAVQAEKAGEMGARDAVKGVRVRGHRIAMSGSTIRVSGPGASVIAPQLAAMAGEGAQRAVKEAMS